MIIRSILDLNPELSLTVFCLQTPKEYAEGKQTINNNVYWKDNEVSHDGYGPFTTVYAALEHWKATMSERRLSKVPNTCLPHPQTLKIIETGQKSNVVFVDFVSKKKIS